MLMLPSLGGVPCSCHSVFLCLPSSSKFYNILFQSYSVLQKPPSYKVPQSYINCRCSGLSTFKENNSASILFDKMVLKLKMREKDAFEQPISRPSYLKKKIKLSNDAKSQVRTCQEWMLLSLTFRIRRNNYIDKTGSITILKSFLKSALNLRY